MTRPKCFGVAGWKNSGKTSLVAGLVSEFAARGISVSTIKHAHHSFDLDTPGTDSFKHREAGAKEVVLVSSNRWAIQHELGIENEPELSEMVSPSLRSIVNEGLQPSDKEGIISALIQPIRTSN